MEFLDYSNRDNNFVDDIKVRTDKGFDTSDGRVRRQSIGWLDDSYLSRRSVVQPQYFNVAYTRVPPIVTLAAPWYKHKSHDNSKSRSNLILSTARKWEMIAFIWVHTKTKAFKDFVWAYLPKSYKIRQGAFIDWAIIRQRLIRIGVPLLLILLFFLGLAFFNSSPSFKVKAKSGTFSSSNASSSNTRGGTSQAKTSNSSTASNPVSTSSPTTTSTTTSGAYSPQPYISSNSSSPTYSSSGSTTGTTTPLTGGMGGGGSTTSTPPSTSGSTSSTGTTSGTSSSLLPATISTPPINTSLGGKTLLNVSPTTITVN